MAELPNPVRDVLRDDLDEGAVQRIWQGVDRRKAPRRWGIAAAVVAVAALAIIVVPTLRGGPVHLSNGDALVATRAVDAPLTLALDDGSRIVLERGAAIEPLVNDGTRLSLLQPAGRARYEVEPGGPRTWIIEAGLASVEVVGTRFAVTRTPERLVVEVERGRVLVRGERVPNRVATLGAHERIEISAPAAPSARGGADATQPADL